MDVLVATTEYNKSLKVRGYAESTINGYRQGLEQFRRFLEERNISDLRQVGRTTILDYQAKVMAEENAMETKALKIRPVKRLFEALVAAHQLLLNPTEGIKESCRRNRKIGPVLTVSEMADLLAQANLSLRIQIRNRAIMELLYSTGVRVDELVNIKVHDVDLQDKVLFVRKGKGGRERVTPLGKAAIRYLKEYLEKIRPRYSRKNPGERALFLKNTGKPVESNNIRVFLREYRISAGINKPVSPHTFRRSCATHLLQQGADIRYIQKLLGHKSLKTTQIYTKVLPVEVKQTHEKTHPNGRESKEE